MKEILFASFSDYVSLIKCSLWNSLLVIDCLRFLVTSETHDFFGELVHQRQIVSLSSTL